MKVTAESYYAAAREHIEVSLGLIDPNRDQRHYVPANYLAGLAVECMLRAYSHRISSSFDARHDLRKWYKGARFDVIVPQRHRETIDVSMNIVASHWNNSQRYYSLEMLRAYFKDAGVDRGIRADIVKELASRTVSASLEIITLGERQWKNSLRRLKSF